MTASVGGRLTRITLSGAARRADLVLPSDEPVGLLVPDLAAMVGVAGLVGPGGYQLSTADGTVLDPSASLNDAAVPDGAFVRLDAVVEAPPAPILHDVADHVSDDADARRGRWNPAALRWTATAVVVVAVALAAAYSAPRFGPFAVIGAGAVGLVAGAAIALGAAERRRAAGVAVALCGSGAALVGCALTQLPGPTRAAVAVLVGVTTIGLLGVATAHRRAGVFGAATLAGQLLLWWVPLTVGLSPERTAAVVAVVGAGLLGLLPRLAVAASGLAALDDRHTADEPVTRLAAQAAVNAAHRGLAVAVAATAASAGLAGWVLAGGTDWAVPLAAVTAAVLFLRLRAFPLTVEVVAVLVAALVVAFGLIATLSRLDAGLWWVAPAAALGVAALALVTLVHRPLPHVRARARQLADRVEALAVVATVPLAVGVYGVYERLLVTF